MDKLLPSRYCKYDHTEEEILQGSMLSQIQTEVFQNLLSGYADERLTLAYDVNNPGTFVQQEAYKKGQIELVEFILASSKSAQENMQELIRQRAEIAHSSKYSY